MLTAPQVEAVMDQLEALAPLLSAEVSPVVAPAPLSAYARAYKEALITTRVLVEKLRVVRIFARHTPNRLSAAPIATTSRTPRRGGR